MTSQKTAAVLTCVLVMGFLLLCGKTASVRYKASHFKPEEAKALEEALTTPDSPPPRPVGPPLIRFVQVTDTHHHGGDLDLTSLREEERRLVECVRFCNETLQPDFVVHTGDIVYPGDGRQLERCDVLMDGLSCPWIPVCGNHDGPDFTARYGPVNSSFTHRGVHFVSFPVMDTFQLEDFSIKKAMKWLEADLAEHRGYPTVLFCHDPVFVWADLGRNHRIMEKAGSVALVLSGHLHTDLKLVRGRIHHVTTWQFRRKPHRIRCCDVYSRGIWMDSYEYVGGKERFARKGPTYFAPFRVPVAGSSEKGKGLGH